MAPIKTMKKPAAIQAKPAAAPALVSALKAKTPPPRKEGAPLSKSGMAYAIAEECEIRTAVAGKIIESLAGLATEQVKSVGKFTFPGMCMIKTRVKPATKACKKVIFGEMCYVKARPARTIVKAFPVAALKKAV